jgi:hypothetical protein
MKYHDYDDLDVSNAISFSKDNCDAARSLSKLLDALVDANFQEAEDGSDSDEEYERVSAAKLFFFKLATKLTNGYREKQ